MIYRNVSAASPAGPHDAFMTLHRKAGTFPAPPPSTAMVDIGKALDLLAAAEPDEIPPSAKLNLLGALAAQGLPEYERHRAGYHAVAESIGGAHGVSSEQVIADVKAAAAGADLEGTATGMALPHHITAFFMQDLCNTAEVAVEGRSATWVFSEFETDAPYADVAEWVDPRNWPKRGPLMFKGMEPVDGISSIPGPTDAEHWHGTFLETVQLVDLLETELHCEYYRQGDLFTGMTYAFVASRGDQLDVDRGFLLVNELGSVRHVKALKIVGFTDEMWNDVARWVCPIWTDFVRGAAVGGSHSGRLPPTSAPGSLDGASDQWTNLVKESVGTYTHMATGWMNAVTSGRYRPDDMLRDGARFWLQVYRDMANASATAYAMLEELAREPAGSAPPAPMAFPGIGPAAAPRQRSAAVARPAREGIKPVPKDDQEGTVVPVLGLEPGTPIKVTDLDRIGEEHRVIAREAISVAATPLTESVLGVRLEADVTNSRDGLYLGYLLIGEDEKRMPVQLYVSRAIGGRPG